MEAMLQVCRGDAGEKGSPGALTGRHSFRDVRTILDAPVRRSKYSRAKCMGAAVIIFLRKDYNEGAMREIDLVDRTMFAELDQRCLDATFEAEFSIGGRFVTVL